MVSFDAPVRRSKRLRATTAFKSGKKTATMHKIWNSPSCGIPPQKLETVAKNLQLGDTAGLCSKLASVVNEGPCLEGWRISRFLGSGTQGTVFALCNSDDGRCAAGKFMVMKKGDAQKRRELIHEINMQRAAAPFAPEIYGACDIERRAGSSWAVILMEKIDGEADAYLSVRRSERELRNVGEQLVAGLRYYCSRRLTHGDLVWFNIGYILTDGLPKFVFIDFDRASDKVGCGSKLDYARLIMELYAEVATPVQKPINRANAQFLQLYLLRAAEADKVFSVKELRALTNPQSAEAYWIELYEVYCRRAGIKCLE